MGVRIVLSDNDFEVLTNKAPNVFEGMSVRVAEGGVKAVRFSTLELICRTLGCEPGDVLKLCDDGEWGADSPGGEEESGAHNAPPRGLGTLYNAQALCSVSWGRL
jgi:hypothetical protein